MNKAEKFSIKFNPSFITPFIRHLIFYYPPTPVAGYLYLATEDMEKSWVLHLWLEWSITCYVLRVVPVEVGHGLAWCGLCLETHCGAITRTFHLSY
jgi:hypothetical protein